MLYDIWINHIRIGVIGLYILAYLYIPILDIFLSDAS